MSFTDLSLEVAEEFAGLQAFDTRSLSRMVDRRGKALASATTFEPKSQRRNTRLTHMHTMALMAPGPRVPGLVRGMTPPQYWRWYVENCIKANPARLEHEREKARRHSVTFHEKLRADPIRLERYRATARARYHERNAGKPKRALLTAEEKRERHRHANRELGLVRNAERNIAKGRPLTPMQAAALSRRSA